ncbi:MAG: hypothetical protein IPF56_02955 [Chloroflexi bacterium]|nr:hypothetical protein [Chloroflexota bacterium]MBK6711330.1 hypothetical protein [Chloroflexota bacterium]MBP7591866.1 hypothetical protein [Chloroflexota bacterium]
MRNRLSVSFTRKQQFIDPTVTAVKPYELELSLFMVFVLTGVYIAYELLSEPRGGHPFGHALGIVGALLMLMTEILYSLRKRTTWLNWAGPVRYWLSFHIFTGIIGPFMVLMHTGLQFRGLAGLSFFLTLIVVGSGFIGRYLYTALPRTMSGVTASNRELMQEMQAIEEKLTQLKMMRPQREQEIVTALSERTTQRNPMLTMLGRSYYQWRYHRRLQKELRRLDQIETQQRQQFSQLLEQKRTLERQMEMLAATRRMMRAWHLLHIPFGLTLFFSVAIHIFATFYYRAGLFK